MIKEYIVVVKYKVHATDKEDALDILTAGEYDSREIKVVESLQELKDKAEKIKEDCEHWKTCQDGSYEMSLAVKGYDTLIETIKELEKV